MLVNVFHVEVVVKSLKYDRLFPHTLGNGTTQLGNSGYPTGFNPMFNPEKTSYYPTRI